MAISAGSQYDLPMYLGGEILDWMYYYDNASGFSEEEEQQTFYRAHDIWRHASSLISPDCSEFSKADAIASLKRAVNHRLKALTKRYCFDALPFDSLKRILEKFQFYGIIRPTMLKELFGIRNAIEHRTSAAVQSNPMESGVRGFGPSDSRGGRG